MASYFVTAKFTSRGLLNLATISARATEAYVADLLRKHDARLINLVFVAGNFDIYMIVDGSPAAVQTLAFAMRKSLAFTDDVMTGRLMTAEEADDAVEGGLPATGHTKAA